MKASDPRFEQMQLLVHLHAAACNPACHYDLANGPMWAYRIGCPVEAREAAELRRQMEVVMRGENHG
jgi:hypothetical protein